MRLTDHTGEPFTASINGAPAATVRQHIETYKLDTDEAVKEFVETMVKGRDIVTQFAIGDITYIVVREFIPSKIALLQKGIEP